MKQLKMLGLGAIAATAFVAILGSSSASASALCSTTADPCPAGQKWPAGTVIDWSIPANGSIVTVNTSNEEIDTCSSSTLKWKLTNAGSATETVTGTAEELTWGSCTFPTNTITKSKLEIHKIAGTSNGTVTADGTFEWTTNTVLFGSCIYGVTAGTAIGEVTEGNPATPRINAVVEKFSGSAFACPSTTKMTGAYVLTAPANTTLSVSSS